MTVTQIYVEFSDATEEKIVALFGGAQDPAYYSYQGVVVSSDQRYKTYYDALHKSMRDGWPKPIN